jgi:hypothetical protein
MKTLRKVLIIGGIGALFTFVMYLMADADAKSRNCWGSLRLDSSKVNAKCADECYLATIGSDYRTRDVCLRDRCGAMYVCDGRPYQK